MMKTAVKEIHISRFKEENNEAFPFFLTESRQKVPLNSYSLHVPEIVVNLKLIFCCCLKVR